MRAFRYMSMKEFQKMDSFCVVTGHHHTNSRTTSDGVCFLGEVTMVSGYEFSARECYLFLSGIVSDEILVEFEVEDGVLTESEAVYADPHGDYYDRIIVKEYCVPAYSRDTFVPVNYCIPGKFGFRDGTWYKYN